MSNKFETVTGEALMDMDLSPGRMIVHQLIPKGLHILAGAPKVGKSWRTLWLCLQAAKGEPVWKLPTEKGTVLYLCLEDNLGRIQDRMLDLTDAAPSGIHFATMAETISGGLINQINAFLLEHPNTILIAIDTLQCIRNISGDFNAYANDYKDINLLKQITDKHNIAILLIHHLSKQGDSDPLNMISDTTGLTGAVDGTYVLHKESRRSRTAKLIATGRDIEDMEYILEFDKETRIWKFISDDSDNPFYLSSDKILSEIVEFIKNEGNFIGTASELIEKMTSSARHHVLAKKLSQNKMMLKDMGIIVNNLRTGSRREITLKYETTFL